MSNDAILIPGDDNICDIPQEVEPQEYLTVGGSLKEIADKGTQGIARGNLQVYSKSEVQELLQLLRDYVVTNNGDIVSTIDSINQTLENIRSTQNECVKKDGSVEFEAVQLGITPTDKIPNALTTVAYVLKKLASYSTISSFEQTLEDKLAILDQYALISNVYKKSDTYCKKQIEKLLESYVKTDGSQRLIQPIEGAYPKLRSHLSTKGYADDVIKQHKNELDPHNFQTILNQKLSNYYKKSETYTKAQTYSRLQIDQIIDELVSEACKGLIQEHLNTTQHLTSQDVQRIIKIYSSANLVTKEDLEDVLVETEDKIEKVSPIWKTSGPVLSTVGFVEDNSELPQEMTLQEILDSIFYGSKISIHVQDNVQIGNTVDVTVCLHGGMKTDSIILYQDDVVLREFDETEFNSGCVTVTSNPIVSDTIFKFKVSYANGLEQEEIAAVRASAPIFVGILPQWKAGNTINMEYLEELVSDDSDNNKFIFEYSIGDISHSYNFKDLNLKKPFIAVPYNYPNLKEMATVSQRFGLEAFTYVDIPLEFTTVQKDISYRVYIYKQPLASMNQDVTFKFTSKEQGV